MPVDLICSVGGVAIENSGGEYLSINRSFSLAFFPVRALLRKPARIPPKRQTPVKPVHLRFSSTPWYFRAMLVLRRRPYLCDEQGTRSRPSICQVSIPHVTQRDGIPLGAAP